jgi:hypothetical protein
MGTLSGRRQLDVEGDIDMGYFQTFPQQDHQTLSTYLFSPGSSAREGKSIGQ